MIDEQALFVCNAQSLALRESTLLFARGRGQPRTVRRLRVRRERPSVSPPPCHYLHYLVSVGFGLGFGVRARGIGARV